MRIDCSATRTCGAGDRESAHKRVVHTDSRSAVIRMAPGTASLRCVLLCQADPQESPPLA
jgi:hypothetical protein